MFSVRSNVVRRLAVLPMSHRSQKKLFTSYSASNPSANERLLSNWMLCLSGLVAGMVTVGGITRLTRSGLSMTDWKLQGSLPPITSDEWSKEFERYKTFPEWKQRQSMTVDEFKFIYFWEYGHRMMGRLIGLAFVGPFLFFSYKKMIPKSLYPRLGLLFGLGGTQGLIGWWMVKSGLNVDPNQRKEIRVSPYRLATHLSFAFTTYALLLWTAFDLRYPAQSMKSAIETFPSKLLKYVKRLRYTAIGSGVLVASTVLSGAYVAGNDAGKAYGTFPMMGDEWIPTSIFEMTPLWRNFFENTATVQFDHRVLAMTTLSAITAMYYGTSAQLWKSLPRMTKLSMHSAIGMCVVQVGLGITTLLLVVPVPLAATHQAGSLVLLSIVTLLVHSLRFVTHLPAIPTVVVATTSMKATLTKVSTAAGITVGPMLKAKYHTYCCVPAPAIDLVNHCSSSSNKKPFLKSPLKCLPSSHTMTYQHSGRRVSSTVSGSGQYCSTQISKSSLPIPLNPMADSKYKLHSKSYSVKQIS